MTFKVIAELSQGGASPFTKEWDTFQEFDPGDMVILDVSFELSVI